MKKPALWFWAIMCTGLALACLSSGFSDLFAKPGTAFQELIMAIILGCIAAFLIIKSFKPGWRLIPESRKIKAGDRLPVVSAPGLILLNGEICHLAEKIKVGKTKTITTGSVSYHSGGSVRIAKGLSVHSGSSSRQTIRKNVLDTVQGNMYITNKRIVVSSQKYNFDKPFDALTSYTMYADGFALQFGKETFTILVRDRVYIMTILLYLANAQ